MWRIFVPLKYLQVTHAEKRKFDLWLPLIFGALLCLPLLSADFRAGATLQKDLLSQVSQFSGFLFGFFIAALAAVATFGSSEMDQPMPGDVVLTHNDNDVVYPEALTRRRFLSFLFGYLAFLSLTIVLLVAFYSTFMLLGMDAWTTEEKVLMVIVAWGIVSFLVGNLLSNTLLGLFYLTDRMHRPNGTNKTNEPHQAPAE